MKILRVTLLSLIGLLTTVGTASADSYNYFKGQSPCSFELQNLKMHGYSPNAAYTVDGIRQLINGVHVEAHNVDTLINAQRYQIAYTCIEDHHIGHINLQAIPVDPKYHNLITNIWWEKTKPAAVS